MGIFLRIWTGIVAAVTGAAIALLAQIIGIMTIGMPIDWLPWLLVACTVIGFIIGVVVGPQTSKPRKSTQQKFSDSVPNEGT